MQPIIVLLGPAGSGKGTQADLLTQKYGFQKIVTGDLVRADAERNTERGRVVKQTIDGGNLLPDETVTAILLERLQTIDATKGMVIDGYPRTIGQAKKLDEVALSLGRTDDLRAFWINISDAEAFRRVSQRTQCVACGAILSDSSLTVCPTCGGTVEVREDDKNSEAIKKRLELFHTEVMPAIEHYKEQNKLTEINGERTIKEVFDDIVAHLNG